MSNNIWQMISYTGGISSNGKSGWKLLSLPATYNRIANQRIPSARIIQSPAQTIAGSPVAFVMFTVSVGTAGANGDARKKTVFRSNNALSTHCTARKLTKNPATLALANRAMSTSPTERTVPASKVNGMPAQLCKLNSGLNNP